jgi:hypothetical protein
MSRPELLTSRPELVALTWRKDVGEMSDPHFAKADTLLRPEQIDISLVGNHLSIPFERGIRTYAFEGQANRDRFVNKYRGFGAKPCGNPVK